MEQSSVKEVGSFMFGNDEVKLYSSTCQLSLDDMSAIWRRRNPDSVYTGIVYYSPYTGVTYPEGVEPPNPTKEDLEVIPKAVIIHPDVLVTDELKTKLTQYLLKGHKLRNKSLYN